LNSYTQAGPVGSEPERVSIGGGGTRWPLEARARLLEAAVMLGDDFAGSAGIDARRSPRALGWRVTS
jgi:hypothetical protein